MIVITVITVHALGKQEKVKTTSQVLTRLPDATLIGWMAEVGREIAGNNGSDDRLSGQGWLYAWERGVKWG